MLNPRDGIDFPRPGSFFRGEPRPARSGEEKELHSFFPVIYNNGVNMKVQLFVPPQGYVAQRWGEGTSMPPLGILSLAAVLEKEGVDVDVVPADILGLNWKDVRERIDSFRPHMVGGTTTTENRFESFRLAAVAKEVDPEIVTVLGGPHISMSGSDTLTHIPEVDITVRGEGELTLVDLVRALRSGRDVGGVKGLHFRRDGGVVYTGDRERIEELDILPFPARHLVPMDAYRFYVRTADGRKRKAQNIMTSRGCPFDCYFCATPANWGRRVRGNSPERVLAEIEHLIDAYGAEFIWFYDDTLNYHPQRLHRIMDMILERKLNIKFCNEFRIDLVDKSLLAKMVEAGLVWGHFGVEAGSGRVRKDIVGKDFDIEQAYRFVRWAKELDFVPDAFIIYSHHTETWEEAQETITLIDELKSINPKTEISTSILHVYPGTPLEAIAKREGIIPADFSWAVKKDMKKVPLLPAAQGDVPLFKDRLTWFQIADLIMRGSGRGSRVLSRSKWRSLLSGLISGGHPGVYVVFFLVWMKYRIRRLLRKSSAEEEIRDVAVG